jgi:hypothetical protein
MLISGYYLIPLDKERYRALLPMTSTATPVSAAGKQQRESYVAAKSQAAAVVEFSILEVR